MPFSTKIKPRFPTEEVLPKNDPSYSCFPSLQSLSPTYHLTLLDNRFTLPSHHLTPPGPNNGQTQMTVITLP